jgi:hypothetical protein
MDNAFLEVNLRKLELLDKKLIELEMKGGGDDEFPLREIRSMLSGMKFEIAKLQGEIKVLTTVKKEKTNDKEGKKK